MRQLSRQKLAARATVALPKAHNPQEFSPDDQSLSVALTTDQAMQKQQPEHEDEQLQLENLKQQIESELSSLAIATVKIELAEKRLLL